jgi:hypothetical protein
VDLRRVEGFLERVFEAPARRLFRARLQPVELSRALARAMEAESQVGPGGLQVPNRYRVRLSPGDFAGFAGWQHALERDLAAYVQQRALERDWHCPGRPRVELHADSAVARGRVSVEAEMADEVAVAGFDPPSPAVGPLTDDTAALGPKPLTHDKPVAKSHGPWLELPDGSRASLSGPVVRIGRAVDNDVVLDDPSVSRYHVQLSLSRGGCVLADLGSTNGTRVDSEAITERLLRPGDVIHLGGVPLRFHASD